MDTFQKIYTETQSKLIESEFSLLKNECYLEHAGATLYSDTQISNIFGNYRNNLYGNPHAYNISSKFTGDTIDQIRYKILEHFKTNSDEYSVIFTAGATAALKLVAETFTYDGGTFVYLEDNHTSVLGMREYAKKVNILSGDKCFQLFNAQSTSIKKTHFKRNSLFVYPAQSNFSGTKYPLSWIKAVHNGVLHQEISNKESNWFCMLDAASYVSTNTLDLNKYHPDFVCLSFYKIFGYPTGLGALLVRNSSRYVLNKVYFGGGTVQMTLPTEHIFRTALHECFEDGTLPFLSILSVRHGFETLQRLNLNMDLISKHTFSLARYLHHNLLMLHHSNGSPVTILYHDTDFENNEYQGGIVNFNLLRDNGEYIGYSEVLHMANLYKIHLRTGCFCNPGACQRHLQLSPDDVKYHFQAGHICGDQNDLIEGCPTGSVRISFGYMSRKEDADTFIKMVKNCFVTQPFIKKLPDSWHLFQKVYKQKFIKGLSCKDLCPEVIDNKKINYINNNINNISINEEIKGSGELKNIFIYPVKSCGAFSIPHEWNIEQGGLQFDREWMVVTSAGVCLTQKQEPTLCLIKPAINLTELILQLNFPDFQTISIPLDIFETEIKSDISLCQSKVCGDRVQCIDCGDDVANWLNQCLQRTDLRLLRQCSVNSRINKKGETSQLSLVNQAQYLLLNFASIKHLAKNIPDYEDNNDLNNLISRFRANFIVASDTEYIENNCQAIEIGDFIFQCTGPCTRCQMICIDQQTAAKSSEPLRTLSSLTKGKIRFGVYLTKVHASRNKIRLHEKVIFK